MSDDLVKRLRDHAAAGNAIVYPPKGTTLAGWRQFARDIGEAADRIEALERELAVAREESRYRNDVIAAAEQQLTAAEASLSEIDELCRKMWGSHWWWLCVPAEDTSEFLQQQNARETDRRRMRAFIAALEGKQP